MHTPTARRTSPPVTVDAHRTLLLDVAYRLLGSRTDAEDAVQETYVRWYRMSPLARGEIASPPAWMVRVTSRVCLDLLGSARRRRERYAGEWLPEPVPAPSRWSSQHLVETAMDPGERIAADESVSMALLVVLESMTPAERVAFVLHDVFGHSFGEVADVVGRSTAACRQLASSARRRIRSAGVRPVPDDGHEPVVAAFRSAWESGDLDRLVALLDPSVSAVIDGGGVVSAAREPIVGPEALARYLLGVLERRPGLSVEVAVVNGAAGLVARHDRRTMAVVAVHAEHERITRLWAVRNPFKLRAWTSTPIRSGGCGS